MTLEELGAVTYPAEKAQTPVLVLAHGAGAGQRHPFMVAVASGLADRGVPVVTFDFLYMQQRRRVPDSAPVLETRFRQVADAAREWGGAPSLLMGGKSMGGRIATHLAAAHTEGLLGVVALGYPLHPPGKPNQLRIAHLPSIDVPVLIVQGQRDAFGSPEELRPVLESMTAAVTLHVVDGGDHSLNVRGRPRDDVYSEVLDVTARWVIARARHSV